MNSRPPPQETKTHFELLAVVVVLASALLRFLDLDHLPPGLFYDESANGVDALRVLAGWHPVFFPGDQGREPLYIYLQAVTIALIGPSPFALRLASAVLGVLTVAATFATFRAMAGATVGLAGSGLLGASFWHVSLSRQAFRTDSLPLFTTLAAFFLFKGIQTGRRWPFAVGGCCVGIALYTYIPGRLAPALFGLWLVGCLLVRSWRSQITARRVAVGSAIALIVFVIVAFPLVYHFYLHPHDFVERIQNAAGPVPIRTPLEGFGRALEGLFWIGDPNVRHNIPGRPLVELPIAVLGVVGGVVAGRRWGDGSAALVLLWCMAMLAPSALTDEPAHALRLAGELPFVLFFPSVALAWLVTHSVGRRTLIGPIVVGLILGVNVVVTARDYFWIWPTQPALDQVFQADLLNSLGLAGNLAPGSTVLATTDVYEGVSIPSVFIPSARTRVRAFDGLRAFVVPATRADPVYYIYAHSFEPPGGPSAFAHLVRLATSRDRFGIVDGELFRADPPVLPPGAARRTAAVIGSAIEVTGVDLVPTVQPGGIVRYGLHWTARGPLPPGQWEFFAHLVDRGQHRLLASDYNHGFPPDQWRDGDQVVSWFDLKILNDAPRGVADVDFGVFDPETGVRLPVTSPSGEPAGNALIVGPVRVAGPEATPPPPQHALNVRFGTDITLEGYDVDRAADGDPIVRLHWRSNLPVTDDYTMFVHLLDSSGKLMIGADSQPGAGELPTSTWQPGELLLDEHRVKGAAGAHAATLEIGAYLLSTGERLAAVEFTGSTGKSIGDALRLPW